MFGFLKQVGDYTRDAVDAARNLAQGFSVTFDHMQRRPVTVQYPYEKLIPSERYRGRIHYEFDKCIACEVCVRVCPINLPVVDWVMNKATKKKELRNYSIDFGVCIFCGAGGYPHILHDGGCRRPLTATASIRQRRSGRLPTSVTTDPSVVPQGLLPARGEFDPGRACRSGPGGSFLPGAGDVTLLSPLPRTGTISSEAGRRRASDHHELICFLVLSPLWRSLGVVLLSNIVYSAFLLGGVFTAVAGLYLLLNASFVAAAQILVYVGAINVLILFAIMLVNKREDLKAIANLTTRRVVSAGVCAGLFALLVWVVVTTPWSLPGPAAVGEEATARIGEHLFTDYLLPFEVASVLLLMAMIGAIVLARRDVLSTDVVTGEVADQGLIEKARTPLLMNRAD